MTKEFKLTGRIFDNMTEEEISDILAGIRSDSEKSRYEMYNHLTADDLKRKYNMQ